MTWDTKHGGTLLCAECGRVNALGYGNNSQSPKEQPAAKPSISVEGAVHRLNDDGWQTPARVFVAQDIVGLARGRDDSLCLPACVFTVP